MATTSYSPDLSPGGTACLAIVTLADQQLTISINPHNPTLRRMVAPLTEDTLSFLATTLKRSGKCLQSTEGFQVLIGALDATVPTANSTLQFVSFPR